MSTEQDVKAPEGYKPLPEIAELITNLRNLKQNLETNSNVFPVSPDTLEDAIALLEKGEPFHPDPHPESGQGKWKADAATFARNAEFYQGIVQQVGEALGEKAYTADDGTVGDSVLALKVPELVKLLKTEYDNIIEIDPHFDKGLF